MAETLTSRQREHVPGSGEKRGAPRGTIRVVVGGVPEAGEPCDLVAGLGCAFPQVQTGKH